MAQPQNPSPRWFLRRDYFVQGNARGLGHSPNLLGNIKKILKLPELFRASGFFQSAQNVWQ